MSRFIKKPCKNCPWKRSSNPSGSDIPNFSMELMEGLKSTVPDPFNPLETRVFACHDSKEGKDKVCAGYLARGGTDNIHVRLMAMNEEVNIYILAEEASKEDLFDSFNEMLETYRKNQI